MMYMVELNFTRPELAEKFVPFYAEHMRDLRTVPGLTTAQRLKSVFPVASPYLQIYTIANAEVMQSKAYKSVGGPGHPIVDEHAASLTDWYRNVFDGIAEAPNVREGSYLLVVDGRGNDPALPQVRLTWLRAIALDRSVAERGLVVITDLDAIRPLVGPAVRVFAPIGPQF
jgi:hypothetical protein